MKFAMNSFVDPRGSATPPKSGIVARTTNVPEKLVELHRNCSEGRLYDVERWIQSGRPLQVARREMPKRRRTTSALEIALDAGNHALALLLLCNGYDPNLEPSCPIDIALRTRRFDLIDLLLEWGTDPRSVCLEDLFDTYSSELFERFRALGADLTMDHALAAALGYHTSNRPLFGFAKRHREADPNIQTELNIALAHHAGEGNEKGVHLCLWAGADPHAPVLSLRYGNVSENGDTGGEDEDRFIGFSAVYEGCSRGNATILKRLGPDPSLDDFEELYRGARNAAVIDVLARSALPRDVGALIHAHLMWVRLGSREWEQVYLLRRLFEVGARWKQSSADTIGAVRWSLLKVPDQTFVELVKLLATDDYCSPEILRELARTQSLRRRLKEVGLFPPSLEEFDKFAQTRPTRAREVLSKLGVEIPKPRTPPPLPHTVWIGPRRPLGHEIRLDRPALYKAVWSHPVAKLAEQWGLSGPGLKKVCRRLRVPVPPRGYWARLEVGQRVRRPRLPRLQTGEAEEIVISPPAGTRKGSLPSSGRSEPGLPNGHSDNEIATQGSD